MKPLSNHSQRFLAPGKKVGRAQPAPQPSSQDSYAPSQDDSRDGFWKRLSHKVLPFTKPRERQWTILYYGAGNNNLSRDLNMEMGGLRNAGSSDEIQVVGQLARENQDVVRGEMAKIPLRFGAVRPEFVERETLQADMGKKETLADFLAWGMKEYPAKHYLVIQAGHGNGHRGSMTDETTGSIITPTEQREAFEAAPKKVDVLLKESCMGASLEEAYEMKESVGYLLASQDVTKGNVDLHSFLQEARLESRDTELSPRALVESMTTNLSSQATTFSAVDCSKLGEIGQAIGDLRSALDTPEELELVRSVASKTARVKPNFERLISGDTLTSAMEEKRMQYKDAVGFAQGLSESVESLQPKAERVVKSLQEAIVFAHADSEHTGQTGLSWNISPDPSVTAGAGYRDLAFAKDTGWTGTIS